ncbi:class I tRNA ligase family protein [Streptomyces indonesiensis]
MSETNAAAEVAAPHRYTAALAADIEARWQDFWDAHGTYEASNPGGDLVGDAEAVARPKKFVMDMFPYPSGAGLHVGHPLGYIATDVFARYHRMTGHNVLHTLGFDAFGLPAEQYAVQTGTHPRVSTEANIENMRRQLRGWAWATTSAARSRRSTRTTTSGPSGSSCRSSTPGTTRRRRRRAPSTPWSSGSPPVSARPPTAAPGPS